MPQTAVKVTPADHGRHMRLADFDHCEVQEGHLYELGRGVIVVSDIPGRRHRLVITAVRRQLNVYEVAHPEIVNSILAGSECKILVAGFESERHPDIAVYTDEPPEDESAEWSTWVPAVVVEGVSPGAEAERRDYFEKREEYLEFGVKEYWIVDAEKEGILVLKRVGRRWKEEIVRTPATFKSKALPGLELETARIFASL